MNQAQQETIQTYDNAAQAFADKFTSGGPRIEDIEWAFQIAGSPIRSKCKVVEVGCGNGRDAREISKYSSDLTAIDASAELIQIARREVLGVHFEVADMMTYNYSKGLDAVFAFAAFLHLEKSQLASLFTIFAEALRPGGIIHMSFKYADSYDARFVSEPSGAKRMFYFYTPQLVSELAGVAFEQPFLDYYDWGGPWFRMVLKKR